jgi:lipopolysaccharide transport system ATP-binding protein
VLIDQGQVLLDGAPKFVVNRYHKLIYAPPDCMEQVRAEIRNDARQLRDGLPPQSPAAEPASVSIPNRSGEDQENAYFDPHMRSQSMLEWPVRGARIVDPHLETLQGRRVNVVRRNHDYCFVYRVEFLEPADQVGFGMLLKTLTGYELGGATTLYGEHRIDHVTRGTQADVRIRFTALMTAGSYFLNAGVTALNGGKEIYLHRVIDALMIRVQSSPRDTCTGTVNLLVQPSFSLTRAA